MPQRIKPIDGNYHIDLNAASREIIAADLHGDGDLATANNISDDISILLNKCDCSDFGDLDLDGNINPPDVVHIVNYVYKQLDARETISSCPNPNGDWNCDGEVNPIDVVKYVNFVYKGVGDGPCDACAGSP